VRVSQHDPHGLKAALWASLQAIASHLIDIISPPGSSQPCSRLRSQILGIILIRSQLCVVFAPAAPAHIKQEECSSSFLGLCNFSDWHLLACTKRRRTLCLQCYNIVPTHHASKKYGSHTRGMSTTRQSWRGQSSFLCYIKMEEQSTTICNHAAAATIIHHMLPVRILRYAKARFSNPLLIIISIRTWLDHAKSCFLYSYALVWMSLRKIHP
jgi:hypothetical protein